MQTIYKILLIAVVFSNQVFSTELNQHHNEKNYQYIKEAIEKLPPGAVRVNNFGDNTIVQDIFGLLVENFEQVNFIRRYHDVFTADLPTRAHNVQVHTITDLSFGFADCVRRNENKIRAALPDEEQVGAIMSPVFGKIRSLPESLSDADLVICSLLFSQIINSIEPTVSAYFAFNDDFLKIFFKLFSELCAQILTHSKPKIIYFADIVEDASLINGPLHFAVTVGSRAIIADIVNQIEIMGYKIHKEPTPWDYYFPKATKSAKVTAYILVSAEYKSCVSCGKIQKTIKRCGKCKNAFYCNAQCQRKDWPKHKGQCNTSTN